MATRRRKTRVGKPQRRPSDAAERLPKLTRQDDLRVAITRRPTSCSLSLLVLYAGTMDALKAFDRATQQRDSWYDYDSKARKGRKP